MRTNWIVCEHLCQACCCAASPGVKSGLDPQQPTPKFPTAPGAKLDQSKKLYFSNYLAKRLAIFTFQQALHQKPALVVPACTLGKRPTGYSYD